MSLGLNRYYTIFGAIYIALSVLVAMLNYFLPGGLGGFAVVVPFIAALLTAQRFVKLEQRPPNDAERKTLTFASFGVFILVNLLYSAILYIVIPETGAIFNQLFNEAGPLGWAIFAGFLLVAFAITFALMWWAYGGLIRKMSDNILKK